jgi:phosphatidylinositol alpha 1,6-mannosyltransferase
MGWRTPAATSKHSRGGAILHGEAPARAYANMDLFVFTSHTDTFGNVMLEALASEVRTRSSPM